MRVLDGGTSAWKDGGYTLEDGDGGMQFEPRDVVPKPYHQGEWAKRTYLEWEEELGQLYVSR
ncbi:hypothetical protein [Haloferax sp. DFSO60]|uniref:hypothetical protein n=1 Tax=Haloferax sp. DFSO60 TaxID=3388652 RepID=UPI00397D72E2